MARQRMVRKPRQCWSVARYTINRNHSVCHIIENEEGNRYHTWMHANGTQACDCESHGDCYHKEKVRVIEQERKEAKAAAISAEAAAHDYSYAEAISYSSENPKEIPGVTRPFTIEEYRAIMERDEAWQREQKEADLEKLRRVKAQAVVECRRRA